jgi:hypothetical protein
MRVFFSRERFIYDNPRPRNIRCEHHPAATRRQERRPVAIERVTGALHGRSGSFILHHLGIMERGAPRLNVTVVPDSGTRELAGIAGTMTILIADGKHSYEFAYTLPEDTRT